MTRTRLLVSLLAVLLFTTMAFADNYNFSLTDGTHTVSFTLQSSPVAPTVIGGPGFEIANVSTIVNGGLPQNMTWDFYASGLGGGLEGYDAPLSVLLNQTGSQLYTGSESAPTFVLGTFNLTNCTNPPTPGSCLAGGETGPTYGGNFTLTITNQDALAAPEPASLFLLGSGLLGLGGLARRRRIR